MTETTNDPAAIERSWADAVNRRDFGAMKDHFAQDFVHHTAPPEAPQGTGGQDLGLQMLIAAFPDFHLEVDETVVQEDRVAFRATARGTQKGAFMGIAATGREIAWPIVGIDRIADGKIVERWEMFDMPALMRQVGAFPPTLAQPREG